MIDTLSPILMRHKEENQCTAKEVLDQETKVIEIINKQMGSVLSALYLVRAPQKP